MKTLCAPLAGFAGLLGLSTSLLAQEVIPPPSAPAATKPAEDGVELPPFQVLAGDNTGWSPTQTLAGTHFRTKLDDLALESKNFTVEMAPLASLVEGYANKKVVIALASNVEVSKVLAAQGGSLPLGLGGQAYGLRTTRRPQQSYWALGGDATGAMYGGLQLAENIRFEKRQIQGRRNQSCDSPGVGHDLLDGMV
jgi:hypothetical protein